MGRFMNVVYQVRELNLLFSFLCIRLREFISLGFQGI